MKVIVPAASFTVTSTSDLGTSDPSAKVTVVIGLPAPDAPPSIAAILAKGQPQGAQSSPRGSKVAELEIPIDGVAIGSRTFQVEVRE